MMRGGDYGPCPSFRWYILNTQDHQVKTIILLIGFMIGLYIVAEVVTAADVAAPINKALVQK